MIPRLAARTHRPAVVPALLLAALALLLAVPGADAGRAWCRKDPVVMIDGRVADILLSSHPALHDAATGPAEIVVWVPVGVPAELLAVDNGFGGHGYAVAFAESAELGAGREGPQVRVDAYVPSANGSLPLVVDFKPRGSGHAAASARGSVNTRWVSLETR